MRCPVCEAENAENSLECATCGRPFASVLDGGDEASLDGFEPTQLASADLAVAVERLPGVESTQVEEDPRAPLQWTAGPIALERTEHETAAGTASSWTSDVEVDRGRETDDGDRTALPPETATCPWCGATSLEPVCDSCGRRKARYASPETASQGTASGEIVSCPSCFARVRKDVRCSNCGVPFPLQEL